MATIDTAQLRPLIAELARLAGGDLAASRLARDLDLEQRAAIMLCGRAAGLRRAAQMLEAKLDQLVLDARPADDDDHMTDVERRELYPSFLSYPGPIAWGDPDGPLVEL